MKVSGVTRVAGNVVEAVSTDLVAAGVGIGGYRMAAGAWNARGGALPINWKVDAGVAIAAVAVKHGVAWLIGRDYAGHARDAAWQLYQEAQGVEAIKDETRREAERTEFLLKVGMSPEFVVRTYKTRLEAEKEARGAAAA